MADDAVATQNDSPGAGWAPQSLEQRLQRLEDAVASLQNTAPLEERITQRVTDRLQGRAPPPGPHADKIIESRPSPAPLLGRSPAPMPPSPEPPPGPSVVRQTWLLFDALRGLWVTLRMLFDVRYHTAWSTRVVVIVLLVLILSSRLWLPFTGVFILGLVLDKAVDLVLAFLIYKTLGRELQRYQQFQAARALPGWRSR